MFMFKEFTNYTAIFQHSLIKYIKYILCQLNIMPISAGNDEAKAKFKGSGMLKMGEKKFLNIALRQRQIRETNLNTLQ